MKENIKSFSIVLFGAFLVALGTYYFLVPNNLAAGGISGIAMVINNFLPNVPIGLLMIGMELVLFTIGILVIGPVFGAKTIFCSFSISGLILILEKFFPIAKPLSNDLLIQLIFGVLICGFGMAIAFNEDASTGGTDILAKILNKYFNISIGKSVLAADLIVTIAATSVFGINKGLYAILGVIINGFFIDQVINTFNMYINVAVISKSGDTIKKYILETLDRSATAYYAKGIYSENDTEVITTVVNRKQFVKLKEYIKSVDPDAFITVHQVNEVLGEGFTHGI